MASKESKESHATKAAKTGIRRHLSNRSSKRPAPTNTCEPPQPAVDDDTQESFELEDDSKPWKCASCGTTEETVRYKSGKMKNCYTCQGFANARINSRQKDGKKAGIVRKVDFTHEEFLAWAAANPRKCRYCGITDPHYFSLGLLSSNGKLLEAIGLDRRDDSDYRLDNIDWCCYPCNRTKSNSLSVPEMELMGVPQEIIWRHRLGILTVADCELLRKKFNEFVDRLMASVVSDPHLPLERLDPLARVSPETAG